MNADPSATCANGPSSARVVVTGATGFLGRHAVANLGKIHHVVATGRNRDRLAELEAEGVDVHPLDLTAADAADQLARLRPDIIVHGAARSSPWGRRLDFEAANVGATDAVLDACRRAGASLVHVSTPSIYMNGQDRWMIDELAPLPDTFVNDYAATKRLAELRVLESGLAAAILRPQAIVGAGDTTVAPRFERIAGRGFFPMIRGRDPVLDMTHVANVATAIASCCGRLLDGVWTRAEVFNITNGDPRPLSELGRTFLDARSAAGVGGRVRPIRVPRPVLAVAASLAEAVYSDGEPAVTKYAVELLATSRTLNIDKAIALLDYDPTAHTIEQAFADYFRTAP